MEQETSQTQPVEGQSYWSKPCACKSKIWMMVILAGTFIVQSYLVYSDPSDSPPLSEIALLGRNVWHENNCQSCHQFYGFGGFIGPDLTNAYVRVTSERLTRLLTVGSGKMPAFKLSKEEINGFRAYLNHMNETGQGQAKWAGNSNSRDSPGALITTSLRNAIKESEDPELSKGFNIFVMRGCRDCHLPLGQMIGTTPSLFTVTSRIHQEEIKEVMEQGRSPAMPKPALSDEELDAMYKFIAWIGENQYRILKGAMVESENASGFWSDVPWWEFDNTE